MNEKKISLIETAAARIGYGSASRYRARCKFLFRDIELAGARVLDIGCGKGAFALWSGLHGARHVLGIEPETDGSTCGTLNVFEATVKEMGLEAVVQAKPYLLQDVNMKKDGVFDIVILFAVINHLDEKAVLDLHLCKKVI